MKTRYNLLFKTGDAELRALERTKFETSRVFPIVELTRGRKSKYDKIGLISKRIKKLSKIFGKHSVCLDLTTSADLENEEIKDLYDFTNGYSKWVNYLSDLKNQNIFKEVIPTILVNTEDKELDENLLKQVENLNSFNHILYRNNLTDDGYYDDLITIKELVNNNKKQQFTFVLDCEYVPVGAYLNVVSVLEARIKKVKNLIPKVNIIVVATSFPRYVSDIGNDETDIFPLDEITIYNKLQDKECVYYGDYGSINPERNDTVTMARGWIPRIDVPTLNGIYYYRKRRALYNNDYALTYTAVARDVVADPRFPDDDNSNWGIQQIKASSEGDAPGSAPSFWISVRMSIFMSMQLRKLKS